MPLIWKGSLPAKVVKENRVDWLTEIHPENGCQNYGWEFPGILIPRLGIKFPGSRSSPELQYHPWAYVHHTTCYYGRPME